MTLDREDIIWLAIRIFGLYFSAKALLLIPDIYQAVSWLHYLGPTAEALTSGTEFSLKTTQHQIVINTINFFLFMVIGIYLLRRGQLLFNLIKLPTKQT